MQNFDQTYAQLQQNPTFTAGVGKAEEAAKRFGGIWKMAFFICASLVFASGVLSIISGVVGFAAPFDFVNYVYLTIFGLLMLVVDAPVQNPRIDSIKFFIFHYALFMTRFVGRGIWYLFLASMVVGALWDNDVAPFLGFILGGFIGFVAISSMIYGWRLSNKLEGIRTEVTKKGPEAWGAMVPPSGLNKMGFRDLGINLRGVSLKEEELNYIIAALSLDVRSDDVITREEFDEWARGPGMTIL